MRDLTTLTHIRRSDDKFFAIFEQEVVVTKTVALPVYTNVSNMTGTVHKSRDIKKLHTATIKKSVRKEVSIRPIQARAYKRYLDDNQVPYIVNGIERDDSGKMVAFVLTVTGEYKRG